MKVSCASAPAAGALAARLNNNIQGIATVKAYAAEEYEAGHIEQGSDDYRVRNGEAIRLSAAITPVIRMAILAGFTVTLLYGGFLALDWCCGTPLDRLARRSFALHAELAETLGNPWGYRRLATYAGQAVEGKTLGRPSRLPWLGESVAITGQIGGPETTALVEPRAFTIFAAQAEGEIREVDRDAMRVGDRRQHAVARGFGFFLCHFFKIGRFGKLSVFLGFAIHCGGQLLL